MYETKEDLKIIGDMLIIEIKKKFTKLENSQL